MIIGIISAYNAKVLIDIFEKKLIEYVKYMKLKDHIKWNYFYRKYCKYIFMMIDFQIYDNSHVI